MTDKIKIGIFICDRYRTCAGGKCFRALRRREGAFARYGEEEVEVVGYTSCDGCPGGNIEYAPEEMKKNGAQVIHLATGLVVGYPPCPSVSYFRDFIQSAYDLPVVIGTHPIPQKYQDLHEKLGTWEAPGWADLLSDLECNEKLRLAYN